MIYTTVPRVALDNAACNFNSSWSPSHTTNIWFFVFIDAPAAGIGVLSFPPTYISASDLSSLYAIAISPSESVNLFILLFKPCFAINLVAILSILLSLICSAINDRCYLCRQFKWVKITTIKTVFRFTVKVTAVKLCS